MTGKIFISYARDDQQAVRPIYDKLKSAGYSPWLDVEDILPGENWQRAINKAIEEADIFLAILSENSVNKRGVIQKEIRLALNKMDELLPGDIFIIPLRVDDCAIPERLADLQILDWDGGSGLEKLLTGIEKGLAKRGVESQPRIDQKVKATKAGQITQVEKSTRAKITEFAKKNGGILAVIVGIITILGVLLQFVESPFVQTIFLTPTVTSTVTATITETRSPIFIPTNTPSPTDTQTPTIPPTAMLTPTKTQIPTDTLTPSITPTHAVTLPSITVADCVPKGALRQKAYVLEAIEADKIKVSVEGELYLIRYLGVDVPGRETRFGVYSFNKNIALVVKHWVTLVGDPNAQDDDEYSPRYVFVDDVFVNDELIRQGFAFAKSYDPAIACQNAFQEAQKQAELMPVGMWKPTNTPWPTPAPGEPPCSCRGDTRNCDSFLNQSQAQACFEYCQGLGYGDVHHLDANGNNWACEK